MVFDDYMVIIYLIGYYGMFFHAYHNMLVTDAGVKINITRKMAKAVFASGIAVVWPALFAYWVFKCLFDKA